MVGSLQRVGAEVVLPQRNGDHLGIENFGPVVVRTAPAIHPRMPLKVVESIRHETIRQALGKTPTPVASKLTMGDSARARQLFCREGGGCIGDLACVPISQSYELKSLVVCRDETSC